MEKVIDMTPEEKLNIAKLIRKETGCGLMEATKGFEKLLDAFKHRPALVMDNPSKLTITWE